MPAEFWAAWRGSARAVLTIRAFIYHFCSSISSERWRNERVCGSVVEVAMKLVAGWLKLWS